LPARRDCPTAPHGYSMNEWLRVRTGRSPLILTIPHTGSDIPLDLEAPLTSNWLARKDTDWWVHLLYDFADGLDATIIRTSISRTVIDVNRDPSGASLYPGQATTDLCPLTTFDGEPFYQPGDEPEHSAVNERRSRYFDPYHAAIADQAQRLRNQHGCIVLFDAHSIRSRIPRLFEGLLPIFNIGTNNGATCDEALTNAVAEVCERTPWSHVTNGRFRGGWTTRHYGDPDQGIHAIQMELAMRSYIPEPALAPSPSNWPPAYNAGRAASLRAVLTRILGTCIDFATSRSWRPS
jgi:N-formylglutamate deformylase